MMLLGGVELKLGRDRNSEALTLMILEEVSNRYRNDLPDHRFPFLDLSFGRSVPEGDVMPEGLGMNRRKGFEKLSFRFFGQNDGGISSFERGCPEDLLVTDLAIFPGDRDDFVEALSFGWSGNVLGH